MKQKFKLITAGFALALVLFATVAATIERDYLLRHLRVIPTTTQVSTNIAEFADTTTTNALVFSTSAPPTTYGPQIQLRKGTNIVTALTNGTFSVTNGGSVQTFTIWNGLITGVE